MRRVLLITTALLLLVCDMCNGGSTITPLIDQGSGSGFGAFTTASLTPLTVANLGETVTLCCVVSPTETPVNVTWNTTASIDLPEPLQDVLGNGSNLSVNSSLILTNVTAEFSGTYTCTAVVEGMEITDSGVLTVATPPIITSINGDTDLDLTENATLTCSVSSPVGVNITWSTSANVTVPDAVTTGNPQTGFNSSITIPSVTLAHDEAVFVCTAVNTAGSDTDSLTLSVMIPPPMIIEITDDINVNYSESVNLTCLVSSLVSVNITWSTKASVPIPNAVMTGDAQTNFTSTITIPRVTLAHNDAEFVCTAVSSAGNDTDSVIISVILPQPTVQPFVNRTVLVGSSPMIFCNASGVNLTYLWFLTSPGNLTNLQTDTVTVPNITTSLSGGLTCIVMDPMGQRAMATINLEVQGLVFTTIPDTNYTLMGNNTVNFTCAVQAPPNTGLSVTIRWYFRGGINLPRFVTVNTTHGMVINASSTLSISQAEPGNEGGYSCRAYIGSLNSQIVTSTHVFVQFAPLLIEGRANQVIRVNRTENVFRIECAVQAVPHPRLVLIRNGTELFRVVETDFTSVNLAPLNFSISGLYTCVANNSFGSLTYNFTVIVQDRPDPIDVVNSEVVGVTRLRLTWTAPNDNFAAINEYRVEFRLMNIANFTSLTFSGTTGFVPVDFDNTYFIQVRGCNDAGCGNATEMEVSSPRPNDVNVTMVQIPRLLVSTTSIFLRWSLLPILSNAPVARYEIRYKRLENPPVDDTSIMNNFTLSNLLPATEYTVSIKVVYDLGNTATATSSPVTVMVTTNTPDQQPPLNSVVDNIAIMDPTNPQLVVTWPTLPDEEGGDLVTSYNVRIIAQSLVSSNSARRRRQGSGTTQNIPVPLGMNMITRPADPFTQYTNQVFANVPSGQVPLTAPNTVSTGEQPSSPPGMLSAMSTNFTEVDLTWNVPNSPNGVISQYTISLVGRAGVFQTPNTQYTVKDLNGGTPYNFSVLAVNGAGNGMPAYTTTTTLAGVFPLSPLQADGTRLTIPQLSQEWGPTSHFIVVVITTLLSSDTYAEGTLHPHGHPSAVNYYVAGYVPITSPDSISMYDLGNQVQSMGNGVTYVNVPLGDGATVHVFVRVYSGASQPMQPYRDSDIIQITTPPNLAVILIPIFFILAIILIFPLVVILIVIFFVRKSNHRGGQYLEVMKSESFSKGYVSNQRHANAAARKNSDIEMKGMPAAGPRPNLSVMNADVFTSTGHSTLLMCEVSASGPLTVTWSRDGKPLQDPQYQVLADHSLLIAETKLYDEGIYTVQASVNGGRAAEEQVRVTVFDPQPPETDSDHLPVTVSEFTERMAILRASMDEGLDDEYSDVDLEWNFTSYAAKLVVNHTKNRYVNIIPYDHSRVQLSIQDNQPGSDYINASFVDGYNQPNAYIATQGPVPAAFPDFWRMIWEYDIPTIVMVTNLREDDKIKCHQYWPSYGSMVYGNLQVTLREVENLADYSIRTFQVAQVSSHGRGSSPAKEVRQFHFLVWPDHGVPVYATALLSFRKRVFNYHQPKKGTMLVHCSAGVGRTGTFITVDCMLKRINAEATLDIFNFVRHMRYRRNYMVQTVSQYEFIHDSLLEAIMCGDTSVHASNLSKRITELKSIDPSTKKTRMEMQLEVLDTASTTDEDFDCSVAQLADNATKNRITQHLPPNDYRVVLSTDHHDSDYICASIVDGYRQRNAFIVTQGPLASTTGDFWRMVWEQKSSAIVMLTQLQEAGREMCVRYWPEAVGQVEVYGTFHVEVSGSDRVLGEYTVRKLKLSPVDMPQESRTITHFHYTKWSEHQCPSAAADLIDMVGEVLRVQRKSGNGPITVHCSDGLGRTGTYCALFTVLERVKTEQVVDVFMTVKSLRIHRAGLLQTLDQYEFVYRAVLEFLGSFDNYENFK